MKHAMDEIETWVGQLDEGGRLHLPHEMCRKLGWTGLNEVVVECDGHSLRLMALAEFTREVTQSLEPELAEKSLLPAAESCLDSTRHTGSAI